MRHCKVHFTVRLLSADNFERIKACHFDSYGACESWVDQDIDKYFEDSKQMRTDFRSLLLVFFG